jgi:hypothetical protein
MDSLQIHNLSAGRTTHHVLPTSACWSSRAGYQWQHGGCVYFGGVLAYRRDPSDGATKLWYNNGRGSFQIEPLCPDPAWPAGQEGSWSHCYLNSARETK